MHFFMNNTVKMDVFTLPSCSNQYDEFIECKFSYSASLCFCCLTKNVPVLNIKKCQHKEFLKHYLTMEISELYICAVCHVMLKRIEAFRQQVYLNYFKLLNGVSKNNKHCNLTMSSLSRTEVVVFSYSVKSEVNPLEADFTKDEFQETEVPIIKNELDSDFDCELPSYCTPEQTIDNSTPTTDKVKPNHRQSKRTKNHKIKLKTNKEVLKKHRQLKDVVIDKKKNKNSIDIMMDTKPVNKKKNLLTKRKKVTKYISEIEENISIEKLEKKYFGKVDILILSMEELLQERAEKSLREPYSKMEYKCESCIKGFIHDYTYESHIKNRHAIKPGQFSCEICQSVFTKKHTCTYHYKRHFKRYVCLVCNKRNSDLESTAEHYNVAHPEREPIEMSLVCSKCDFNTNSPRKYRYHMDLHRGGITCDKCNKIFCTQQTYNDHVRLCHNKSTTTFKCDRCSKPYKFRSGLFAHKKYGECASAPVKRGYCVQCNMHFKSEKNYIIHLKSSRAHVTEDAFKFTCDLCDKKFKLKAPLELHMIREHLKIKNFKCTYCGKMFFSERILKNHVNYVHLKKRPPRDKICDFCGKTFHHTQVLQSHIRIHTGERPLNCPFCDANFAHKAALYTHKKLVHKVPKKNTTQ